MLLDIHNLRVEIVPASMALPLVADVSLAIAEGESLALVGESGSGKSMTASAITRTLPHHARVSGEIRFDGRSILRMSASDLQAVRRREVGVIYQNPRAHINPVHRIEDFLLEGLLLFDDRPRSRLRQMLTDLLGEVGIADPERCLRSYPHQLSGGMLQRVAISAALATSPRLLIADEPTTALDVTTQAEVAAVLKAQQRKRGLAVLFITHDLDLAAEICDRTAVIYSGRIVETQPSLELYTQARHPYSQKLLDCRPSVEQRLPMLPALPGHPTPAFEAPPGCPFSPRCDQAMPRCTETSPRLVAFDPGSVACHLYDTAEVLGDGR
ncbi:MAG: ABC transporter ATP-binding protein [Mesorhizobium sp.]|uniref:ABC transporter ATP-binding protein n=1 Tax=Mesorhizobium sp. TaxID=1871066 RepID=UPI000FE7C5BA|nr:ABC transporter ATP-binding protein [Mesorhizobium sp.]RWI57095.1 MAG: ABC transporter ATP-binding protein [Mesorhizobium sp.]